MELQLTENATTFPSLADVAYEERPSSRGSVGSTAATKIFNLPISKIKLASRNSSMQIRLP